LKNAKDRDVVEYAGKHGFLLVTQDQKPAELADLLGVKCVFISGLIIAKLVDQKIKELKL
jgi:predicted nuclease of predicted toxin-antitoxin system